MASENAGKGMTGLFTAAKMAAELARLRDEAKALRAENEALRRTDRRARQWDNLLCYDGRPQGDNLGGTENGQG